MVKKSIPTAPARTDSAMAPADGEILRQPAEVKYADELDYLASADTSPRPFTWRLSPRMVRLFVLGSRPADKLDREIKQKFYGDPSVV
jgi:hypothetical protein